MIEFFRSLFRRESSSATARERLRLVLLSDHLELSPEIVDAMKSDLLSVISRYVEIDAQAADVTFEHREREIAMLASVPILNVRPERLRPALTLAPAPAREPRELLDVFSETVGVAMTQAAEAAAHGPSEPAVARPRRRRRRRRVAAPVANELGEQVPQQTELPPRSAAQA